MVATISDYLKPISFLLVDDRAYIRREKFIMARNASVTEYVAKRFNAKSLILPTREVIERPRPFVDVGLHFGPGRRRGSEVMSEGEEIRGKGGPCSAVKKDLRESLSQERVDKLLAGDAIRDRQP